MKNIFTFILILVFTISNAFALEEKEIPSIMQQKINIATQILIKKELSLESKTQKIFKELEPLFDIPLMAKLTLGKQEWGKLTKKQKLEFINVFNSYMKKSYTDKLSLYNGEAITVKDAKRVKKNRIFLNSEIQGEKETFKVIYKFYKHKKKGWLIYDVEMIGVSIIKTYQAQFQDTIVNNSFEYLLNKLKSK